MLEAATDQQVEEIRGWTEATARTEVGFQLRDYMLALLARIDADRAELLVVKERLHDCGLALEGEQSRYVQAIERIGKLEANNAALRDCLLAYDVLTFEATPFSDDAAPTAAQELHAARERARRVLRETAPGTPPAPTSSEATSGASRAAALLTVDTPRVAPNEVGSGEE